MRDSRALRAVISAYITEYNSDRRMKPATIPPQQTSRAKLSPQICKAEEGIGERSFTNLLHAGQTTAYNWNIMVDNDFQIFCLTKPQKN